jgi:hypothetical protein
MTDYDDMVRGTVREWFWARVILVGGFIVAIAVAGYFGWQRYQATIRAQQQPAPQSQAAGQKSSHEAELEAKAKGAMMFCAMELLNAKNMGVVPSYGQLASPLPEKTAKTGRYACTAATQVTKYRIEANLVCRQLTNPACVQLHSITSDDGTVLYQSKN